MRTHALPLLTALVLLVLMLSGCQTSPWWAQEQRALGDLRVQQKQLETREEVERQWRDEGGEAQPTSEVRLETLSVWTQWQEPFARPKFRQLSADSPVSPANVVMLNPPRVPWMLLWVVGEYVAAGPGEPPRGVYRVYKDGELERETPMDLRYAGRVEFAIPINRVVLRLPRGEAPVYYAARGAVRSSSVEANYFVEVELTHGDSQTIERVALGEDKGGDTA